MLNQVHVGEPVYHESLTVFPLYYDVQGTADYALAREAILDGFVKVRETSEAGTVNELRVINKSRRRVLFLEGEELVGAKQNRILNSTALIPGKTSAILPVSCVEQRRWHYRSKHFHSEGRHSDPSLRYRLRTSVHESLRRESRHASDQSGVWREISARHESHGVRSETGAMADTFETCRNRIEEFKSRLPYKPSAKGLAIAIGNVITGFDLFDKPSTCMKMWDQLLGSAVVAALSYPVGAQPKKSRILRYINSLSKSQWQQLPAVGRGDELRTVTKTGIQATVLVYRGVVIHATALSPR